MLEKVGVISSSVCPWSSLIVIVPKKAQPGEIQKHVCVNCHTLNSLLLPVVKAHLKAQGVLCLLPLLKIDELYVMLNSSAVYSSLDCTSGYHYIALSPEAQKKTVYVTPFGKFEFKYFWFSSSFHTFLTFNKQNT